MARGVNTKANGIDFRANRFDEFLKLIPQNLTDAEKAQVMANLGITPTPGSLDGAVRYDAAQTLTDEQKQQAQENAGVAEALDGKANNDGYYSKMTVGAAENLVGGNETSREFTRDTAGGSADIADGIVKIDRIKGNTIVWNQQFTDNSDYFGKANVKNVVYYDHTLSFTTDSTTKWIQGTHRNNRTAISGHKYLLSAFVLSDVPLNSTNGTNFIISVGTYAGTRNISNKSIQENTWTSVSGIHLNETSRGYGFEFKVNSEANVKVKNFQVIDLTKMFGAGNEPATVAEFKKMFPLDYYDYNTGQLLSLNPTGIKTVGFNAYNHTTGKASVIGGKQYQITGAYTSIMEGDTAITPDEDGIFTTTKNGDLTIVGGNSTTTCIHLVWSGVRNGEYEEHWEETRNIPISQINTDGTITESAIGKTRLFPDGLCSAGSVHDEITPTKVIKRIGKVDLGSLNWLYDSTNNIFYRNNSESYIPTRVYNTLICSKYSYYYSKTTSAFVSDAPDESINMLAGSDFTPTASLKIMVKDSSYSDAATFKAAMSGVYLYYELATPVEVTFAEPLNLTYRVSDFGTETLLPINTATPVTTPIRLDVIYGLNVVDFVRNADKNYLTIEDSTGDNGSSFTNLRSALSTAFGIDIVPTYDSTNKRYTFAISDNRKVEVPSSATASGLKGTWAEDETAVYFCTEADTWVKINKETW